jgi:hypothetical protein
VRTEKELKILSFKGKKIGNRQREWEGSYYIHSLNPSERDVFPNQSLGLAS